MFLPKKLGPLILVLFICSYGIEIEAAPGRSGGSQDLSDEQLLSQGKVDQIDDWGSLSGDQLKHLPDFGDIPTEKVNDVIDKLPDNRKNELNEEQIASVNPRSKLGDLGNYDLAEAKAGLGIPDHLDVHLDGGRFNADGNFVTAGSQVYDGDTFEKLGQNIIETEGGGFAISNDNGQADMGDDAWTFSSDDGLMQYIAATMNDLGIQSASGTAQITSDGTIVISDDYSWHEVSRASHYQGYA